MSELEKSPEEPSVDFIRERINDDVKRGVHGGAVVTRFPPEPNGYLHIGHAKSICLNFGIAREYGGRCHLRFDDTNPLKEDVEYTESIQEDVRWLGFDWGDHLHYASDYFEQLYQYALVLIRKGLAYVDHLSGDQIREYRGTLTEPGRESPFRGRSVEENLELFERMKRGELADGECVLRAKIDMASPNIVMRDPVIYRIRQTAHHRSGDAWCIYPMYDFTHCISDSLEGITHSLCTLEFEINRPLYDWVLETVGAPHRPQQIEFARLNLSYTVMSKRKLLALVKEGRVRGWDDPRMPTICGLRRRGYTREAIRLFAERIGISKVNSVVDYAFLEFCLREVLNKSARRVMAVLEPLLLVIDDYPEGRVEWLEAENNPEDPSAGTRKIPFSRRIYIEREDFRETPPPKYHRLSPGREIRLKHAYYVTCVSVIKDEKTGAVKEVHCTHDPDSRGGWTKDGRMVKGTSHWVSAGEAVSAEVRLYDKLFTRENPDDESEGKSFIDFLNPDSLKILSGCLVEPGLREARPGETFQFLRQGYFCVDLDSRPERLVWNRTVTLKDTWSKIEKKSGR